MDKHTWKLVEGGHELAVERLPDGGVMSSWGGKEIGKASHERVLGSEILRLAERVRELEGVVAMRDGTLAMAVARLGGQVEGAPTHRGNFLQRIDQLVEDDDRWRKACLNYEGIKRQQEARLATLEESLAIARRGEEHEAEQRDLANQKLAALEEENRRLREQAGVFVETAGRAERLEEEKRRLTAAALDLRGFVVWHRHDGAVEKLVRVVVIEDVVTTGLRRLPGVEADADDAADGLGDG